MKTDAEIYFEYCSGDVSLTQYGPSGSVDSPQGSYAIVLAYLDEDDIRADIAQIGAQALGVDPKAIADELANQRVFGGDIPEDRTVYALTTAHDSGFTYYTLYATEEAAIQRWDELEEAYGNWAEDDDDFDE